MPAAANIFGTCECSVKPGSADLIEHWAVSGQEEVYSRHSGAAESVEHRDGGGLERQGLGGRGDPGRGGDQLGDPLVHCQDAWAQARADARDTRQIAERRERAVLTTRAMDNRDGDVTAPEYAHRILQTDRISPALTPRTIDADRQWHDVVVSVL